MLIYDSEYRYNGELPALPEGERIRIEYTQGRIFPYRVSYWYVGGMDNHYLPKNYSFERELNHVQELRAITDANFKPLANAIEFTIHYLDETKIEGYYDE